MGLSIYCQVVGGAAKGVDVPMDPLDGCVLWDISEDLGLVEECKYRITETWVS